MTRPTAGPAAGEVVTLALGFAVLGSVFFERQAPLFVLDEIGRRFDVGGAAQGALSAGIGIGWGVGLLVAWWTSGRWADRTRVLVGLLGTAAGALAVAGAPSWWALVGAHTMACCCAGSTTPAMMSLAYRAAPRRRRGLAAGTVLSASRLGGSLAAPVAVTYLAVASGWRAGPVLGTALLVATAVAVRTFLPAEQPGRVGARSADRTLRYHPGGHRNLVLSAGNCASLLLWVTVVSQFGVPLLGGWFGSGPATAGAILGSFGVGSALAAFAVPLWSDRIGRRTGQVTTLAVGCAVGLVVALLAHRGVGSPPLALALLALGGGAMGGLPMALSLIPAEAVLHGDPGRAMVGPTLVAEVVGGALLPAAVTVLAARAGPPAAMAAAATLMGVAAVASLWLAPMPAAGPGAPVPAGQGAVSRPSR